MIVEKEVLKAVREKLEITAATFEEWQALYGNKKKESTATIPDEIANLQMWSDDDSDDGDDISFTAL